LIFAVLLIVSYYYASDSSLYGAQDDAFDSRNRYILRNFDKARPMSNFLNGFGGLWGIPMWAFYVNRGQAITSFGKQNKDSAIAKFVTVRLSLSVLFPFC
jgi:hypothetical protein